MRCARLAEREDAVDDRPYLAGGDQVIGAFEVVRRSHRRAENRALLPPDAVQGRRRIRAGGRAADHDAALWTRRVERPPPRCLADVVDHDVRAAAGRLLDERDDVAGRVVDRSVRTELPRAFQLRVARRGDDHVGSERLRQRHRGQGDPAADAPDQHPFVRLHAGRGTSMR